MTDHNLPQGTPVTVTAKKYGHGFEIGQTIFADDHSNRFTGNADGSGPGWYLEPIEYSTYGSDEPDAQALADADDARKVDRPLIDFSGSSRATARTYAGNHVSRINTDATNETLKQVAAGEKVDAYALNEALLDAMRGAATRAGQSPLRRIHGTQIAYLGHIAQAVLESHADNLPVYLDGDRSRKIKTLEGEIAALKTAGQQALNEVEATTEILQRLQEESGQTEAKLSEVERIASERDRLLAETVEERDDLARDLREAQRVIDGLTDDLTRHVALREYVETNLLKSGDLRAVAGFTHGWVYALRA